MMNDVMGLINLCNEQDRLSELTRSRCIASVPFAGKYRLVDFALSNMVNSGITNVAVLAAYKSHSLIEHLGNGKEWDLERKRGGLSILPSTFHESNGLLQTDIHHFYFHQDYLRNCEEKYVIIAPSYVVCNMNYTEMVQHHRTMNADITLLYKTVEDHHIVDYNGARKLELNEKGEVTEVYQASGTLPKLGEHPRIFMDIMIMERSTLLHIIETSYSRGNHRQLIDAVFSRIGELNVQCYPYLGYLALMNSIENYYAHSMNLLHPEVWRQLIDNPDCIYTKARDEPPATYKERSLVRNSLVANGCIIEGFVENSILFPGVSVDGSAMIKNSIIMDHCEIESGACLENVILDKNNVIERGTSLFGQFDHPFIAEKSSVIR